MDCKMDDAKKKCPNCSQLFNLKSLCPIKGNIPLFLSCGHSVCENCITTLIKFAEPVQCKICDQEMEILTEVSSTLLQDKMKLYNTFPVNTFLLGELVLQKTLNKGTNVKEEDFYIDIDAITKSPDKSMGICVECKGPANKMCKQCATVLCHTCFNKTHKNFVVFQNHALQDIQDTVPDTNYCKLHKTKLLEYYCKECLKCSCMDCLIVGGDKSCKDHNVVSITDVNENFLIEIHKIEPEVVNIYRRLTKTAVDIGNNLLNMNVDSSNELSSLFSAVEQHFSKLCLEVQKHRREVIETIMQVKNTEKLSLIKAKNDIENSIKNTKTILDNIKSSNLKQMDLASLLDEAKAILDTPWSLTKEESNNEPIKVKVNEDLSTLISDYIHLEGTASSEYKLRSMSEFGEDEEIPPPPKTLVHPPVMPKDVRQSSSIKLMEPFERRALHKEVPKYHTKSESTSSINSIGSDSSNKIYYTSYGPSKPASQQSANALDVKPFVEGSQELVYVSHIVDPHDFYVQRASQQVLIREMVREFRSAANLPKPNAKQVTKGNLYVAYNKVDNMWQRARVIGVDTKDVNNLICNVTYIDFGSCGSVRLHNLRLLSPPRQTIPPIAIQCTLANCVPRNGTWTTEDSILMQKIINNKQAVIHIRRLHTLTHGLKLECDLFTLDDGVNLAQALVFHDRANLVRAKLTYPKIKILKEKPRIYINNSDYKPHDIEEVFITNVVSPDKFFVRKRHLQATYDTLCEDLEKEYNNSAANYFLPEVGGVCAVSPSAARGGGEAAWARGVVHELPGRGRARVLLPDTGALLVVPWTALRHLDHKFARLRALTTECQLANVTPPHGHKWSPDSVALLRSYDKSLLEMHVQDVRNKSPIGVILYDKSDENNIICINKEMINLKLAIAFGIPMFNKNYGIEEQVKQPQMNSRSTPQEQPPKPIRILKKTKIPDDVDLKAKDKGPLRLEAKILNYQSPSLFYVSLLHLQKQFGELFDGIQKYYSTNSNLPTKAARSEGERCCVFSKQSQTWRRAVILELKEDAAKVFYSDFAVVETVPAGDLKELAKQFASAGDAAIKCHLAGVVPADGEEWPSLTKEFFKELLDAYKRIYVTKRGKISKNSMSVELWAFHVIQGGALEPDTSEWRCLNEKIIEQGLGVREKQDPDTECDSKGSEDNFFLTMTGSVHDWLQSEPMPMKPMVTKSESGSDTRGSTPVIDKHDDRDAAEDTIFISDWLPAEPLKDNEFTALPTYIDNNGIVYLHDIKQQDTLDLIRKALDVRFKKPDPKAKFAKWTVGEPCIALFFLDNLFYRGRVLEVHPETSSCLIQYVDYGNEEKCSFEDMRKSIALYQIPVQAHRCLLDRIRPVGEQWDRLTLDYIHKSIVEKQCTVKITGQPIDNVIPIDLTYNKLLINDHLVEFEMAVYVDGHKPVTRKFAPQLHTKEIVVDTDSGPDYILETDLDSPGIASTSTDMDVVADLKGKNWNDLIEDEESTKSTVNYLAFPKNDEKEFLCNIILINNVKMLELNIIHEAETNLLYEQLSEEIKRNGKDMPPLNGIFVDRACIALFHEDNEWYRATILEYSEAKSLIKVRFVDFGNIEVVSSDNVREICEKWAKLPPECVSAKLYSFEINPDIELETIVDEFKNTFLDKGPYHATVIEYVNSIPFVELKNDDGDLIYKNLIEKGIFVKSKALVVE